MTLFATVIPAKAGIHQSLFRHEFGMPLRYSEWIPAFAGMTMKEQIASLSPGIQRLIFEVIATAARVIAARAAVRNPSACSTIRRTESYIVYYQLVAALPSAAIEISL